MRSVPLAAAAPLLAALGLLGLGLYVWQRGGLAQAGAGIGAGVVNAAGGAVSGAVGAVSAAVGLPTPSDTTTDPRVSRWIIDNFGYLSASRWSGLPALLAAAQLDAGTGTPPPPGTAAALGLGVVTQQAAPLPWAGIYLPTPPGASFDDLVNQDPYARKYGP